MRQALSEASFVIRSVFARVVAGDWRRWDTTGKPNLDASTAWVLLTCEEHSIGRNDH
jgi:hypothetical protein